jgi:parvulin-like peptidyl-prolyl isomerase
VRIVIAVVVLGAATLGACKREAPEPRAEPPGARAVVDAVARVGGRPIGASEVEARMLAEAITGEAALAQLIDEELLVREAERLGLAVSEDGERTIERVMVRTMLHDLERETTPESISEEEVREDYALHADKLQVPERRRSWHILVKDTSEAGEAQAESILRELREVDDPRTVYERYANGGARGVKAEDLPAISEKAGFKKSYKDALFAAKSEGPLRKVVKTSYGWHAIVLTEILPEEHTTLDEVEGEIRERLSQKKRFERLVEIVQHLEAKGLVHYNEQGVERLLSMTSLPERGE